MGSKSEYDDHKKEREEREAIEAAREHKMDVILNGFAAFFGGEARILQDKDIHTGRLTFTFRHGSK